MQEVIFTGFTKRCFIVTKKIRGYRYRAVITEGGSGMNGAERRFSYRDLKLNFKILLIYFIVLAVFIMFSFWLYNDYTLNITKDKVREYSEQVLTVQESSIENTISSLNNISRMIIANSSVQNFLKSVDKNYTVQSKEVFSQIMTYMDIYPVAKSITIYDRYHNKYGINNNKKNTLEGTDIFSQDWFHEVEKQKGGFKLIPNIYYYNEYPGESVISLVRIINDIETQRPIGVLVLDILERQFLGAQTKPYDNIPFLILDADNHIIISNTERTEVPGEILDFKESRKICSVLEKNGDGEYVFSGVNMDKYGWKIVNTASLKNVEAESKTAKSTILIMGVFCSVIFIAASFIISRSITRPVQKLIKSMNKVKRGSLKKVELDTGKDEIGILKDNYNEMIEEIDCLIKRGIQTEKDKRTYELNVLYEQIKPHFLYNTLDTIGYLVLSGDKERAYTAIENLGSYYHGSLSHGSTVVTVEEEIKIVIDYLGLQKLRYGDIFDYRAEIEPELRKKKVLKLILQPIVENSLYHGIRPGGIKGSIRISVYRMEEEMFLRVEDTGVGMEPEKVEGLYSRERQRNSFGLCGTMERIRIYYAYEDCCEIISTRGMGTRITFKLPLRLCREDQEEVK